MRSDSSLEVYSVSSGVIHRCCIKFLPTIDKQQRSDKKLGSSVVFVSNFLQL